MTLLKKNTAYTFYLTLADSASPSSFKANPTIAIGDFKISKDGGAFVNLATLPVVEPASSVMVKVSLSATEMDADKVNVVGIDVAGAEWNDVAYIFDVQSDLDNLADAVWDEILKGNTHNVKHSAAKRLRNISSQIIHTDIARGPATNGNQIELALSASDTNGAYDPAMITIIDGEGAGQTRLIYEYDGNTRIATVDRNWKVNPDNTSEYIVFSHPGREHVSEGLARGGTTDTITLNNLASSKNDVYNYQTIFLRSGTGEDQTALIIGYDGTTKIATIAGVWATIPDTTTGYAMLPSHNNPIAINSASFHGAVTIDVANGVAGTIYPTGTRRQPSNNLNDAKTIALVNGLNEFLIVGNLTIGATDDIDGYSFVGENLISAVMILTAGCTTNKTSFREVIITGVVNGPVYMERVGLQTLSNIGSDNFPSMFFECVFRPGITAFKAGLVTPQTLHFINCISALSPPILDFNGTNSVILFRKSAGSIVISNYTGGQTCVFEFNQGEITIDSSCTSGTVELGGIYKLNNNGTLTVVEKNESIARSVLDALSNDHLKAGSIGKVMEELYKLQGMKSGEPMTVTRTSRVAGDVVLDITGDGQVSTTVTRQ